MEIYCEAQDQDNDKFYTKVTRDSSLDAGVGEYVLIVSGKSILSPSANMPSSTKKRHCL